MTKTVLARMTIPKYAHMQHRHMQLYFTRSLNALQVVSLSLSSFAQFYSHLLLIR